MCALATLSLFLVISSALSLPEKDISGVKPEYLDSLLETGQYELFAEIMNIPDAKMVRPNEGERDENEIPMFNKELELGDIMPVFGGLKEEARQGLKLENFPIRKWPNRTIPYYISTQFTSNQRAVIEDAIDAWNNQVNCLKLWPFNHEKDYVYVISGRGCWSYLGRIGGQQSLSLQSNGCVWKGIVLHEFEHAAGFTHEHNRLDRDNNVDILLDNIPDDWKGQYQKADSRWFNDVNGYDYYSIMHYPVKAPGTDKDAFSFKGRNVDRNRVGRGTDLTKSDILKLNALYCN